MSHDENKAIVGQHYGLLSIIKCCQEVDRRVFNKTLCWMNPEYEPQICKYQKLSPEGKIYACNRYYVLDQESKKKETTDV
jgi:hypothetical protein